MGATSIQKKLIKKFFLYICGILIRRKCEKMWYNFKVEPTNFSQNLEGRI